MNNTIDLNCDMGEGMPAEASIMPWISSANIACGYHAGDESVMCQTIELALQHGVAIGAHPSYPDRANFGRIHKYFPMEEIKEMVLAQLHALNTCASRFSVKIRHVKPHGALYNMAAKDPLIAQAIGEALLDFDASLILYGLSGSVMIETGRMLHLKTCHEVFADRTYQSDASLTPRTAQNALLHEPEEVIQQVLQMVLKKEVTTLSGKKIPIIADTLCLHGDGQNAALLAKVIHEALIKEEIQIKAPFL